MRAEVVGVSLRNYKLMAFAIGAAYAGIGGALFAPLLGYIDPGAFTLDRSIQFLMMVVMGGLGRFEGPFIGAVRGDGPARGAARLGGPLSHHLRAGRHPHDAVHAEGAGRACGTGARPSWLGDGRAPARWPRRRARPAGLSAATMALLEIRDLTKHFFRLSALSQVSLSVEPGELLGVIGPNGSGKTTLFNCVTGVLRPSGGQVRSRARTSRGSAPISCTAAGSPARSSSSSCSRR